MVNNINVQIWLDKKYPKDGVCERNNDQENKGKKREDIVKLDISKGKVGSDFFGSGKNLTGSLKLTGFTKLQILICSSHQITELDVSDCLNLEELDCQGNQLTDLNVGNFHYLSKIDCSSNNIKKLNLNGCAELKELCCTSNKYLNEVDISKCPILTTEAIKSDLGYNVEKGKLIKVVSQIVQVEENDVRNILIIGITGGGKSTLANVLAGSKFEERDSTTSVTSSFQKSEVFKWKEKKYRVVDNIGFGDTNSLTTIDILHEIGKGIYSAKNKVNQVLFVISGRFTPEQAKVFNLFKDFISESRITEFTTLIRTNFTNFRNPEKCQEDKDALLDESQELKKIIESCNGFVYVDNPAIPMIDDEDSEGEKENKKNGISISEKKRKESRERVLNHLVENCQEIYKLKEWESIHNKIVEYVKEIGKKEKQLVKASNDSEKNKLENEIKEERKKFAEEMNATLGIKIGLIPELSAEIELRDIKCCSIS